MRSVFKRAARSVPSVVLAATLLLAVPIVARAETTDATIEASGAPESSSWIGTIAGWFGFDYSRLSVPGG